MHYFARLMYDVNMLDISLLWRAARNGRGSPATHATLGTNNCFRDKRGLFLTKIEATNESRKNNHMQNIGIKRIPGTAVECMSDLNSFGKTPRPRTPVPHR